MASYLLFLLIFGLDKLEEFHEDILSRQEPDGMDFLFFKKRPHMVQTFLYYFF